MSDDVVDLVSPNLLFRHRIPCAQTTEKWTKKGVKLDAKHQLAQFGQFEGQNTFAQVRAAWSPEGLFFDVTVTGKTQSIWCRTTQILESDSVMIFVDTRNTQSIHRASRFCHWFVFLPTGTGSQKNAPGATMLKINRAKEDPKTFQAFKSNLNCKVNPDGYHLQFFIAGQSLTGWDTDEHRQLGFNYLVNDRELGEQTLAAGTDFPITSDPSLWNTLQLV